MVIKIKLFGEKKCGFEDPVRRISGVEAGAEKEWLFRLRLQFAQKPGFGSSSATLIFCSNRQYHYCFDTENEVSSKSF